jgi:antitoxin component of MazEF toxin-antitoxin module
MAGKKKRNAKKTTKQTVGDTKQHVVEKKTEPVVVKDTPTEPLVEKTTEPDIEVAAEEDIIVEPLVQKTTESDIEVAAEEDIIVEPLVQKTTEPTLAHEVSPCTPMALHSEFVGHGDPIMDVAIEHWDEITTGNLTNSKKLHPVVHQDFQSHGDPLLKEYENGLKVAKGCSGKAKYMLPKDLHLEEGEFAA